ncbi:MAG: hypothetical protein HYY16_05005 [Planctomycetes bacterium]|nr:hypothetical protein [Planctomycetota bacterium]
MLAGFSAVFALFGLSLWLFRHREENPFDKALHFAHSESEIERELALDAFRGRLDRQAEWIPWALRMLADSKAELRIKAMDLLIDVHETSAYPQIVRLLGDKDGAVQEHGLNRIQELGLPDAAGELMRASGKTTPDLRVKMLTAAMEFGEKAAVDALLEMLAEAEFPNKWKRKATDALASHVEGFPYPLDRDLLKNPPRVSRGRPRLVAREPGAHDLERTQVPYTMKDTRTRSDVILRDLKGFAPGEKFNSALLRCGLMRLRSRGYFDPEDGVDARFEEGVAPDERTS